MSHNDLLAEVRQLNIAYMMLVQKLVTADPDLAQQMLKVDPDTIDVLAKAKAQDLARMSQSNQLLCHLAFENAAQIESILKAGADDQFRGIHASILLDSKAAENDTALAIREMTPAEPHTKRAELAAS